MYPVIYFGDIYQINSYDAALALAVIVPFALIAIKQRSLFFFASFLAMAMYAGGRAGAEAEGLLFSGTAPSFTFRGSLSFWWGLSAAMAAAPLAARQFKVRLLKAADTLLPYFSSSMAIIRLGCLLNGCCYAVPCDPDFFLATSYAHGSPAWGSSGGAPLYPVQLYYAAFWLCVLLTANILGKYAIPHGLITASAGVAFSLFSLAAQYIRHYPSLFERSVSMIFPILLFIISLLILIKVAGKAHRNYLTK